MVSYKRVLTVVVGRDCSGNKDSTQINEPGRKKISISHFLQLPCMSKDMFTIALWVPELNQNPFNFDLLVQRAKHHLSSLKRGFMNIFALKHAA